MISVKKVNTSNYLQYKRIRLEMLEKYPTNFGSSYAEEVLFKDAVWINRLNKSSAITFALMDNQNMVGLVVLMLNLRSKMKHIATVYSMYIQDAYQGKGYANLMLENVFKEARLNNVEKLRLSVVYSNEKAIKLYKKNGFYVYGIEKGTIKINDQYYDLTLMEKELGG